jgi:D-alanyl-lipoteichoic acid acyltransferase DltB (MBOAT superfamily)
MLFHSLEYAIFLVVVFVLYWLLARWRLWRLLLLLVASYLFYASWSQMYLILIVASSVIDYLVGLGMGRTQDKYRRKLLLLASLTANLGMLGVFKYYNFFLDSLTPLLQVGGLPLPPHLEVLLPVGISFYTFQTMSYTIDIYRGHLEPCRDPLRFFVYVAFFPQLVAGPIVRAVEFLPQLAREPRVLRDDASRAAALIMMGLTKKLVIGDYLAVNLVDRVFETPQMFSSLETLLGVYGYAMQIYCDFSGYTDIAIGSALLLGLQLPINFDRPYQSDSLQNFWRRWHISLSSWLRDYLYIPLGGSRGGSWGTYRNLIITMLLGGLWHGAAWNFVIWGAMHGVMLMFTRMWQRWRKSRGLNFERWWWYRPLMMVLTFHFVCLTWIMFRVSTLEQAGAVIARIFAGAGGLTNLAPTVGLALAAGYAVHLSPQRWKERGVTLFARAPILVQALILVGIVWALREVATSQVVPFIYFQF